MNSHYFLLEVFFPPGIRIYHIYQASPSTVSMKLHDFDFHIQFKFFDEKSFPPPPGKMTSQCNLAMRREM